MEARHRSTMLPKLRLKFPGTIHQNPRGRSPMERIGNKKAFWLGAENNAPEFGKDIQLELRTGVSKHPRRASKEDRPAASFFASPSEDACSSKDGHLIFRQRRQLCSAVQRRRGHRMHDHAIGIEFKWSQGRFPGFCSPKMEWFIESTLLSNVVKLHINHSCRHFIPYFDPEEWFYNIWCSNTYTSSKVDKERILFTL